MRDVFGEHAPVQRCIRHKERNVLGHLPERDRTLVRRRLRAAWAEPHHDRALERLELLAGELSRSHPGAAGSLREGMAETLTIQRLGVTGSLTRTICSMNPIESGDPSACGAPPATSSVGHRERWPCAGRRRECWKQKPNSARSSAIASWENSPWRSSVRSRFRIPTGRWLRSCLLEHQTRIAVAKFYSERDILFMTGPAGFATPSCTSSMREGTRTFTITTTSGSATATGQLTLTVSLSRRRGPRVGRVPPCSASRPPMVWRACPTWLTELNPGGHGPLP